jgi:hypothetical protein
MNMEWPMRLSFTWAPLHRLARWPVTSQVGARRNALVACTALAQRRAERTEVEQLLGSLAQQSPPVSSAAEGSPLPAAQG